MAAAVTNPTEQARVLRALAERVENGTHTVSQELAALLAEEAEDAEIDAIAEQVMDRHASILEALAK